MKKGFSTLEIMIAMVILLTAISAIIMTSFGSQSFLIGSQTNSEALNKAKELLENTQAQARKDFRAVNSSPIPPNKSTDGYYTWWTDVGPSTNTDDHFTKQVTTHVEWTDDSTITRDVKLSNLVTNFENAIGGDTCDSFLTGNWASPQTNNILFSNLISNDSAGLYPLTDIEAYNKKLYVAVNQSSQTIPTKSGTSAINKTGVGSVTWSSTSNALSNGGGSATSSISGLNTSNYLYVKGYGTNLKVPEGATILGIQVDVTRSASSSGGIIDNQVRLIKSDGTTLSSGDRFKNTTWNSGSTIANYGNASDLWGETWSASDINDTDFGVVFSVKNSSFFTRTASVDYISVTVTYIKQLYVLDITNPNTPVKTGEVANNPVNPSPSVGFNAIATNGKYIYAAVNAVAGGQLAIIDTSTNPYTTVKTFTIPGVTGTQGVGKSIFYRDGYIYLGLATPGGGNGPEFHIIDVHNPTTPTKIGSWPASGNLGNDISSIKVRGRYAYITTPNDQEVKVLSINDPSNPTSVGFYNATDAIGNGKSLDLVGDTLYLGRTITPTSGGPGNPELYIVNIKDPTSIPSTPLGTKEVGSTIHSILIRDYLAFLLTGTSTTSGQLQLKNISDPLNITQHAGNISLPNTTGGLLNGNIDCEGNYIYVISVPANGTFQNKGSISIIKSS